MKKVLIAIEDDNSGKGAFDFACQVNEINPLLLTGVFLREPNYAAISSAPYFQGLGLPSYSPVAETFSPEQVEARVKKFEANCQKNNIKYHIHQDTDDFAIEELKKETRFADVLLISSELVTKDSDDDQSTDYLKGILHVAECPVLVVPTQYQFPENIVLAYDGSESSVFAIKQFAYVFPELCDKKTTLVNVSKDHDDEFPEKIQIEELTARHFTDLTLFKMTSPTSQSFPAWINEKKGALLVTGSYGRPGLFEFFKKSFATDVIRAHTIPVFITHK